MRGRSTWDREYSVAREIGVRWKNIPPERLMPGQIADLINEWKNQGYARGTVSSRRDSLKRILRFLDRTHRTYLADSVPKVPPGDQRHRTATQEEVSKLLAHASTWMRCLIYFARILGMRRGEILDLTPAEFDHQTHGLNFPRKMGGTSGLPVPPHLEKLILFAGEQDAHERVLVTLGFQIPGSRPHLHRAKVPDQLRLRRAMYAAITYEWNKLRKKAGVGADLRIHDLRHTAATEAFAETGDLRTAQQLLGHRSLSSTIRYLAPLRTQELREQLANLNHAWLYKAKVATQMKQ
jgi:integrase